MRWPSKDPDDYMEQGRWETDPPRWLSWLGKRNPDPIPYWLWLSNSLAGFMAGLAVGIVADWQDPAMAGVKAGILAQFVLSAVWRLTRTRRQRRSGQIA